MSVGHLHYSAQGSDPARVWGIQLNGYTPTGGHPTTLYQYADAVNPYNKNEPSPPFWFQSGKDWKTSYSFIIPTPQSAKVKITVSDYPQELVSKDSEESVGVIFVLYPC
ncbi:hypothetical protein R3P38DRAFT_3509078 [Favolaschia claudopus]|uniref:Uncharacterized protein n=1 Tax=Favolaschia claudopus TaxID=2862362 RepID=A0AAV9Z1C0_9AGAR